MSIVEDYLNYTNKWKAEYGEKTIVLMQVGSFYEAYALKNPDGSSSGSNIEEFAAINDFIIAEKHICVGKLPVLMAGFGLSQRDKYVRKLQEHDYTIVIYKQDVNGKNTSRSLDEIISPGTFFGQETQELSNNIMAIWLYKSNSNTTSKYFTKQKNDITIGVSNIDIFTGKTTLFQFSVEDNNNPLTYDELERYVSAYKPSECLFVFNFKETLADNIISFVGLDNTCRKIHKVELSLPIRENPTNMITNALNAEKQKYQKEILMRFYESMTDTLLMEYFSIHCLATQSFCFLLDFVYQHSPNLVRKLLYPIYENHTDKLVLANHSLRQLNIIDDQRHTGKHRSVSSLLNNCVTTMGKRSFIYNMHNPTTNVTVLNDSYTITAHLLAEKSDVSIRTALYSIKDIEKFTRKLVIGKIVPKDFALLSNDLTNIAHLFTSLKANTTLTAYIEKYTQVYDNNNNNNHNDTSIASLCNEINADLEHTLILNKCINLQSLDIDSEDFLFINMGISSTLDALTRDSLISRDKLESIRACFSDIIKTKEKATKKETEYIKIHTPAKSDSSLIGTSRRVNILKSELNKMSVSTLEVKFTETTGTTFELNIENMKYDSIGMNIIVTNHHIREITSSIRNSKDKLAEELLLVFNDYIRKFLQKFEKHLEHIKNYISQLDMLQCKCYIAHRYNYCRPTIAGGSAPLPPSGGGSAPLPLSGGGSAPLPLSGGGSAPLPPSGGGSVSSGGGSVPYINFTGIRHPLIEHIQTNELYVTNDLHIGQGQQWGEPPSNWGETPRGLLLFGTNAVGKTSFIKSVGIALIMAQAGLYVPCASFDYKPYSYIFTRILGNDNLFKGLSTFAAEMSELRTILLQADENSLVLGDELCSGTESDSALSIFTAGLEHLHAKKSTFLFATHFHEIVKFDEIKALTHLKMKHMAVKYDNEHSVLVYDRKLQDGPGDSMYGLEVCKSLSMPDTFLQRAHDIRMKYNKTTQNMLALNTSHFNTKKIMGNCQVCKIEKASEVHHLQHQKNANRGNEYIDSFHKNHLANLINICDSCHQKIHSTSKQHKVQKTTNGDYILVKI